MVHRFETNWYTLRDTRIHLVNAVQNKKNSYARRAIAMDKLRTMVMHAGVFALTSVHNSVKNNEMQYFNWTQGKAIVGLTHHIEAPERIGAFVSTMDISLFNDMTGAGFIDAAFRIFGLGSAKATFMAALLGFDECCCIDTHMFRMAKEKGITNLASPPASLVTYRKMVRDMGWTHTLDQWRAFMVVPYYAEHQHDTYFRGVLGDRAILAAA